MDRVSALPPELLSNIAFELIDPRGNSALFDLRLTCKQLHDSCDAAFLNAYFGERWHLYTEYSLKALCGISKDFRLRKRLTWLRLSFPEADHMHLDRHVERCHSVPIGSKSKRRLVKKCDDDCLLNDTQEDLEAVLELCSELLEAALENFATAGITPNLGICRREMITADGDFGFYISGTPDHVKTALLEQIDLLDFEEDVGSESSDDSMESDWDVQSWDTFSGEDDGEPDREAGLLDRL